jgi:DNA-directed RNA polymerase subunit RPC12/RpoP
MTCRESRGNVNGCDARCPYFAPRIVASSVKPPPLYPLEKCYMRHIPTSGAASVIVVRRNPDKSLRAMFLSLDLWKVGIRECFVDVRLTEEQLTRELRAAKPPFEESTLSDCQQLVKAAERISREVGYPIPWEYDRWQSMLDDMKRVPDPPGSLYKCAKCGGDLPENAAALMKTYALQSDVQFYIVCRKCGGEFADEW